MKVFVTGVNGYIGTVLAPVLMEQGMEVVGLDTGYYRDGWLYSDDKALARTPLTINKDLRRITRQDLEGADAVVHLAELSNDPLGQNKPAVTHQINHRGSVAIAEMAREAGIRRFVYASSCSVYGAGTGDFVDETTPPNPQTAYAECKVLVERDVGKMAGTGFLPGLPAKRNRLRAFAAHALRYRNQRPVRPGVDHEKDRDDERRKPLAPRRAYPGHLRSGVPERRRAGQMPFAARSSTSGRIPTITACARSPRSSPASFRAAR